MYESSNGHTPPLPALIASYVRHKEARLADVLRGRYSQDTLLGFLADDAVETRKAAAYALSLIGEASVGTAMARGLRTDDPIEHIVFEQALWRLWFRSGRPDVDALLREGVRLMEAQQLDEARERFDRVIGLAPEFPEGYNQRAIVYYMMGEWAQSIADCERVVAMNPVHFGALAGLGHCYLQQHQAEAALAAYERALAVNPHMDAIRERVRQLRDLLGGGQAFA